MAEGVGIHLLPCISPVQIQSSSITIKVLQSTLFSGMFEMSLVDFIPVPTGCSNTTTTTKFQRPYYPLTTRGVSIWPTIRHIDGAMWWNLNFCCLWCTCTVDRVVNSRWSTNTKFTFTQNWTVLVPISQTRGYCIPCNSLTLCNMIIRQTFQAISTHLLFQRLY